MSRPGPDTGPKPPGGDVIIGLLMVTLAGLLQSSLTTVRFGLTPDKVVCSPGLMSDWYQTNGADGHSHRY